MGFFAWIREGVRRAVLLGFSDAAEELGNRAPGEDLGPQLALAIREGIAIPIEEPQPPKIGSSRNGRKRLGRSLEQIRNSGKPA